jgi:hypothetical protein
MVTVATHQRSVLVRQVAVAVEPIQPITVIVVAQAAAVVRLLVQ